MNLIITSHPEDDVSVVAIDNNLTLYLLNGRVGVIVGIEIAREFDIPDGSRYIVITEGNIHIYGFTPKELSETPLNPWIVDHTETDTPAVYAPTVLDLLELTTHRTIKGDLYSTFDDTRYEQVLMAKKNPSLTETLALMCYYAQEHVRDTIDPTDKALALECTSHAVACFLAQLTVDGAAGVESDVVMPALKSDHLTIGGWVRFLTDKIDKLGGLR